jgi:hypothetical protein
VTRPICRRIVGVFLFVLASAVAVPLIGFHPLQSLSTFAISLGIAEGDGAAVLFGVAVGLVALALMTASVFSARVLRRKAGAWLRQLASDLGSSTLARVCQRFGLTWIARILTFQWTELLLLWNPERVKASTAERGARRRANGGGGAQGSKPVSIRRQPSRRTEELIAA